MQPENNVQNNATEGQKLETAVKEVVEMETKPVTTEAQKKTGVFVGAPKKNNGMLYGLIFCIILAIGGIGFGVWTMVNGGAEKEQLNSQIDTLKAQNDELMGKNSINNTTIIDIDDNAIVSASDYIYVGEWGLKVKVPDSLETVTYTYDYGDGNTVLKVSGVTKDSGQDLPDFASVQKCSLGTVDRYSQQNVEYGIVPGWYPEPFMEKDGYSYYFNGPQDLCTEVSEYAEREQNTSSVIKEMLTSVDNYSAI